MITKKDFEVIAQDLHAFTNSNSKAQDSYDKGWDDGFQKAVICICNSFSSLNPRFKKDLFLGVVIGKGN